jgi:hypothetical protein
MRINEQVEPLVREIFAASISAQPDRFEAAGTAIQNQGDLAFTEALNLAEAVCAIAFVVIHQGQRPDKARLDLLTGVFVESEAWAAPSLADTLAFLTSLANQTPASEGLSLEEYTLLVFVLGGWLLAGFLPEGKRWYTFLDEILSQLEASPSTAGARPTR